MTLYHVTKTYLGSSVKIRPGTRGRICAAESIDACITLTRTKFCEGDEIFVYRIGDADELKFRRSAVRELAADGECNAVQSVWAEHIRTIRYNASSCVGRDHWLDGRGNSRLDMKHR